MVKRILIADDNIGVRRSLRRLLESEPGFEVCEEVSDGVEVIERIQECNPDLLILDFAMPRMNGLQVAAALQVMHVDIPIMLFTSYVDSIREEQYRRIGIRSMVSKDSPIEVLLSEVHRLVGTARAASG